MKFSSRHVRNVVIACAGSLGTGCSRDGTKIGNSATESVAAKSAGTVVDSVLPREIEIARFRMGLSEVTELSNALPSRDALVDAFVKRLAARDTVKLGELALTKSEFAWIYYPSSPIGKPPYDLSPALMYFQFDGNNRKGFVKLIDDRSEKDLKVVGFSCASTEMQDKNIVYSQCTFKRLQAPGDTLTELLFGGIIERNGKFKLLNFANKF